VESWVLGKNTEMFSNSVSEYMEMVAGVMSNVVYGK